MRPPCPRPSLCLPMLKAIAEHVGGLLCCRCFTCSIIFWRTRTKKLLPGSTYQVPGTRIAELVCCCLWTTQIGLRNLTLYQLLILHRCIPRSMHYIHIINEKCKIQGIGQTSPTHHAGFTTVVTTNSSILTIQSVEGTRIAELVCCCLWTTPIGLCNLTLHQLLILHRSI